MTKLTPADIETILTALHERRNRLISIDHDEGGVHITARPVLRTRIQEINRAIRALEGERRA